MPQTNVLELLCMVAPLGVQIIVNLLFIRSWWDFHHSALGRTLLSLHTLLSFDVAPFSVVVDHPRWLHHTTRQGHRWSSPPR